MLELLEELPKSVEATLPMPWDAVPPPTEERAA